MIYKALEVIQIFLAGERAGERTKVFQEVLADLKTFFSLDAFPNTHLPQSGRISADNKGAESGRVLLWCFVALYSPECNYGSVMKGVRH